MWPFSWKLLKTRSQINTGKRKPGLGVEVCSFLIDQRLSQSHGTGLLGLGLLPTFCHPTVNREGKFT